VKNGHYFDYCSSLPWVLDSKLMQNSKKPILMAILVLMVGAAVFGYFRYQKQKKEEEIKITELQQEGTSAKSELMKLYEERHQLTLDWSKSAGEEAPANIKVPFSGTLNSETDFAAYDLFQTNITQQLSYLLNSPKAMKVKPSNLEKLEESINRTRSHYHEYSFEENDLISKYGVKQPPAPVFPAEKSMRR